MKLSVAMIVKNEEKNLDRTLKALNKVRENIDCELIIVDTGSSDSTMDIARRYTDKLYEHEWTGNFAEMRNISISYCTGDWILVLDADEVLINAEEMIKFFNSPICEKANCASIKIKSIDDESKNSMNDAALVRIFRNIDGFKYTGKVHEQPKKMFPIAKTNIEFLHYGYSADDYELMNYKFKRNIKLLEEELDTKDVNRKIYILFQLSKSYAMAKKNDEAFKYIKMAYDLEEENNKESGHTYVYHWYACMLFNKNEYETVIDVCKEIMQFTDNNMDIHYMMAISYSRLNKYEEAYKCYSRYFEIKEQRDKGEYPDDFSLSESSGACESKMRSNRIICYYKQKRYSDIVKEFEENIEELEKWKDICALYVYSCIYIKKLDKIYEFYKEREIDDFLVEMLIKNLPEIEFGENSVDILAVKKLFSNIDQRFKIYFDVTEDGNVEEIDKIDFSVYCFWKEKILEKAIVCNPNYLEVIKDLDDEVVKCYIANLIVVYENLELIYNYCNERFLITDISELTFICNIENVLLFNKSIKGEKYTSLVLRTLINRQQFRRNVFNEKLLSSSLKCFLSKYDKFLVEIEDKLKSYALGRVEYLKKMNELLKKNKEYSQVINALLKEVSEEAISEEMIREKDRIMSVVENYIFENRINEAENIIHEIEETFKWDKNIYNCKGVINYIKGEYENALFNLSLAAILMDDKFEPTYNIACVLEKMGRVEDSIVYYEDALNICSDESMRGEIQEVLKGLRKI